MDADPDVIASMTLGPLIYDVIRDLRSSVV